MISSPSCLVARSQRAPHEARRSAAEVVSGILRASGEKGWADWAGERVRAERVLFLIDTFQRAALHPKVNVFPPPSPPLIPANKRESVLSITICAYKSILYPSFSLSLLRATIVFLLPLPKWTLFTLKKGKGKKDTLLKNPGDVLIASPLHHGWKIRGCEMWIPKPVAAGSCGDKRRKPMLDCPL